MGELIHGMILQGLYPYGMDPDQSLYDYARVDYENHWALSENTVARGYDIGYARTFKMLDGLVSMQTIITGVVERL